MKALVFGEILWDIIEGTPHLGGAPLNFAAHLRQCGLESAIISCVGNDELGNKAFSLIKDLNVDVSMVQRSEVRTGFVPVTLKGGQPDYEITPNVAYDYIDRDKLDHQKIADYDLFYFGSLIQRSPASEKSLYDILDKHPFDEIFYDVNLRKDCYNQSIIENSLRYCTILKLNDEEVDVLGNMLFGEKHPIEAFCRNLINRYKNIKIIVITAGAEGSYVFQQDKLELIPTEKIEVADTVGAGDAFSAAFVTTYTLSGDPVKAAEIANRVGGFVASSRGPIPKYSEELLRDLKA